MRNLFLFLSKKTKNNMNKAMCVILSFLLTFVLSTSNAFATEENDLSLQRSEEKVNFEISTFGSINGLTIGGKVIALVINSPVIICSQLKACAYGTAYNAVGSGVGTYSSGDVPYYNTYQALAVGQSTCYTSPACLYAYSRLIHVGYQTYYNGPFSIYP